MSTDASTGKCTMGTPQKLKLELPPDPNIILLGMDPKGCKSFYEDIFSSMFIAALIIMA